jgi:hypothetical protein
MVHVLIQNLQCAGTKLAIAAHKLIGRRGHGRWHWRRGRGCGGGVNTRSRQFGRAWSRLRGESGVKCCIQTVEIPDTFVGSINTSAKQSSSICVRSCGSAGARFCDGSVEVELKLQIKIEIET